MSQHRNPYAAWDNGSESERPAGCDEHPNRPEARLTAYDTGKELSTHGSYTAVHSEVEPPTGSGGGSVIRRAPRPDNGFLIIRNDVVRDRRLSYRARGLLVSILSRPDNWTASAERLASETDADEGVKSIRTAMRELEKVGYLVRRRLRGEGGKFTWEQVVFDVPQQRAQEPGGNKDAGRTISPSPSDGLPPDGEGRSLEEPTRSTEEEDVEVADCLPSGRFAPCGPDDDFEDPWADPWEPAAPQPMPEVPRQRQPTPDWRTQDRELFKSLIGDRITTTGSRWTLTNPKEPVTYPYTLSADSWYNSFRRTTADKKKAIKWPGKFFEHLHEMNPRSGIEDWLMDQGLEIP